MSPTARTGGCSPRITRWRVRRAAWTSTGPVYLVLELEGELIRRMWAFLERDDALRQAGIEAGV